MRSKSFRRLRISLRHRWIAGESISYARLTFSHSVSVFRPLSLRSLSRLAQYTQPIERSERYVFPTAKIPNRRRHKFCFHFVFFLPSKIKLLFFRTRMTTTTGLSLSLSLSLLRSHRHVRSRFVRALFARRCEGQKCLFPSSKEGRKKLLFRVYTKP